MINRGLRGIGTVGAHEQAPVLSARPTGSVVDAGSNPLAGGEGVGGTAHDQVARVDSSTVFAWAVMLTSLAEFTILVPCVLREFEHPVDP